MISTRRASLLVILAHPDDEIFHTGVLAHLSDRSVRVWRLPESRPTRALRDLHVSATSRRESQRT